MIKGSKLSDVNHYGGGMTQSEVAENMGFSQQYIQQIEKQARFKFIEKYIELYGELDLNGISDGDLFDAIGRGVK